MDLAFGGDGNGGLGQIPLEQWFFEMPVCTRWWTSATILTGVLVQCHILTPFQLFYSYRAVFHKSQYWRLITTFIYFGPLSFNLIFHIFFLQRYARMLEESAASPAYFSWMMAYAATSLLCLAPFFHQEFLGTTLSSTLVYIWSRRHPDTMLSFLGVFTFKAPWLPFVMIALSVLFHGHWPKDELFGIVVGHVWYFMNDVFPTMHNGSRPFDPPRWWIRMFERDAYTNEPANGVQPPGLNRNLAAAAAPEVR